MNVQPKVSQTPRTDALALGPVASLPSSERWAEAIGFARTLERENQALRAALADLILSIEHQEIFITSNGENPRLVKARKALA